MLDQCREDPQANNVVHVVLLCVRSFVQYSPPNSALLLIPRGLQPQTLDTAALFGLDLRRTLERFIYAGDDPSVYWERSRLDLWVVSRAMQRLFQSLSPMDFPAAGGAGQG